MLPGIKNIIVYLTIMMLVICCKDAPNYNPFDEQFDVSTNSLIRDKCDVVPAGCGYFNFVKKEGKLKPYYQVYIKDLKQVVAKGFFYEVDTLQVVNTEEMYTCQNKLDSIKNLPIDKEKLNKELREFGYQINSRTNGSIQIVNSQLIDTINLDLRVYPIIENHLLVRKIEYFTTEGN